MLRNQVPPKSSSRSMMTKSLIPISSSLMAAQMPPSPAPMIATS
ncbi:Uncharacterised protein [Mycobacteroides abscessus subsp. abscessus]|nr:Uncharacterised protein [Mycobacteroides abscessus subsp. abscessus]